MGARSYLWWFRQRGADLVVHLVVVRADLAMGLGIFGVLMLLELRMRGKRRVWRLRFGC